MAVLGFDLHDSNLPMKGDFPILIQNLLGYLLPDVRTSLGDGICGEPVTLPPAGRALSRQVTLPDGRALQAAEVLEDTMEQGVYTWTEEYAGGERRTARFALHMAPEESDVRQTGSPTEGLRLMGGGAAGRELTPWVLLAILALLLVEWGVSRRVG